MTQITLTNAEDLMRLAHGMIRADQVRSCHVTALVDTGATTLMVPESVAATLGLPVIESGLVTVANGARVEVKTCGPARLELLGRSMSLDVMVLPGCPAVLLGQIPLEFLALVVDPRSGELRFDPNNPDGSQYALAVA